MVHETDTIEPDQQTHEEYQFYVDAYAETYPALRDLIHGMTEHVAGQETIEALARRTTSRPRSRTR